VFGISPLSFGLLLVAVITLSSVLLSLTIDSAAAKEIQDLHVESVSLPQGLRGVVVRIDSLKGLNKTHIAFKIEAILCGDSNFLYFNKESHSQKRGALIVLELH